MIDRFAQLLEELSTELDIPLHPENSDTCLLNINDSLEVQLECDPMREKLLVASFVCDIPPGKHRENVLKDALKANHALLVNGILAYSDRNNKLTLFTFLPCTGLTGPKLAEFLGNFIEKATQWRSAVESGQTAHLVPAVEKPSHPSPFGLNNG
ncbi:MAG: CesT family type III secretion system chaperone [Verrucomicrobia bacterium]|nr:CesT family type III secretion system chaperone [Verrucomicrobiota bacterium]